MGVTVELDSRHAKELARELEEVPRALATYSLTAELAIVRRDWMTVHDAAEAVNALAARFAELRTKLLIAGVHRRR